jgi:hypothetical protein
MRKHYDFSKAKRGAVVAVPKGKSRITIRLDDAIIDWFKTQVEEAGGGNYQSLINVAADGRIRRWVQVPEMENRYLRVILLPDGETVHNAFFDRRFVP